MVCASGMSSDKVAQYSLTPRARDDLENIWRYSAENWSTGQADKYIRELTGVFGLISSMPLMARERTEFAPRSASIPMTDI